MSYKERFIQIGIITLWGYLKQNWVCTQYMQAPLTPCECAANKDVIQWIPQRPLNMLVHSMCRHSAGWGSIHIIHCERTSSHSIPWSSPSLPFASLSQAPALTSVPAPYLPGKCIPRVSSSPFALA